MTEKEAKEYLSNQYLVVEGKGSPSKAECIKHNTAIHLAIKALDRQDADGCSGCAFETVEEWEMPCRKCQRGCKDYWRAKGSE